MTSKIPAPVAIVAVIVVLAIVLWFGLKKSGIAGPEDATQANIEHYRALAAGKEKNDVKAAPPSGNPMAGKLSH